MKVVFLFVSCILMIPAIAKAAPLSDKLIEALIKVESNGDDNARGDLHLKHKAYGCLQIREPVCIDVNRRYGTNHHAEDCLGNRELSIKICKLYIDMYARDSRLGHAPTDEDRARIWNGGPNGWRYASTQGYWKQVHKVLED
jgi:hypothetical protein